MKRWSPVSRSLLSTLAICLIAGCTTPNDPKLTIRLAQISQMDISIPEPELKGDLDIQQAIDRALANSADVATLVATVNVVAKERLADREIRDPEIRIGYGEDEGDSDRVRTELGPGLPMTAPGAPGTVRGRETGRTTSDRSAYGVSLRVFPRSPWTRNAQTSEGSANVHAAVADLLEERWALGNDVRRLFAELHFLNEERKLMEELSAVYKEAVTLTKRGFEAGQLAVADVMSASRRYLGALADRDESTRRRAAARRELAAMVGLPTEKLRITFDESAFSAAPYKNFTAAALQARAIENRRDLAALYWRKTAARAALKRSKRERLPWFTFVEGSFGKSESSMSRLMQTTAADTLGGPPRILDGTLTEDDGDEDEWGIRTGITLPIFPWANYSVDLSLAEYRRAAIRELRAREHVKREIHDALQAIREIAEARDAYEQDTDPLIQEMEIVVTNIGSTPGLDPIDIARLRGQIYESRLLSLESELEHRLVVIDLEEVLGLRLSAMKSVQ